MTIPQDEMTHFTFINAYLVSKGVDPVDLDQFRTLPSSQATGAQQIGRLTNLMQLTVDTSYWTRYRSPVNNPDLDPNFTFPQAIPGLFSGKFPAIPRTNADLAPGDHLQAIANTAGFHEFPVCSIIRPTDTEGAATAARKALTADGLFIGQSREFFKALRELAEEADAARPNED